jgi:hypothetical protein
MNYLLCQDEIIRLLEIVGNTAIASLDYVGNMYTYRGRTAGPEGTRLYVYSYKHEGSEQFYGVSEKHVIIEFYRLYDGRSLQVHHLSRRRDAEGKPEIIFINEHTDKTLAIIPLNKEVAGDTGIIEHQFV